MSLPHSHNKTSGVLHFVPRELVGVLVLGPAPWCRLKSPAQVLRVVTQNPPQVNYLAIQVIENFMGGRFLPKENRATPEVWLDIVIVLSELRNNAGG